MRTPQYESDGGVVFCAANNNNAITVPLPGTRTTGAMMYLIAFNRLITASVTTAPTGYTLLTSFPVASGTASGGRIWVYGKIAGASESAPTIAMDGTTGTSGDVWGACIFCYREVDTTGGVNATLDGTPTVTDASGTTTCTYPALTISFAKSMVVRFLARFRDAADTFTPTATWTEREDTSTTNRLGAQFHLQEKAATASGSQATVTVAPSNTTAARYLAVTMALKGAAEAFTRTVPDGIGFTDARSFVKTPKRTIGDGLAFTDSQVITWDANRSSNDDIVFTDLATPVKSSPGGSHSRSPADGIAFTDARTLAKAPKRTVGDALALTDARVRTVTWHRSRADTFALTDARSMVRVRARTIGDGFAFTDSTARSRGKNRGLADLFAFTDTTSRLRVRPFARQIKVLL